MSSNPLLLRRPRKKISTYSNGFPKRFPSKDCISTDITLVLSTQTQHESTLPLLSLWSPLLGRGRSARMLGARGGTQRGGTTKRRALGVRLVEIPRWELMPQLFGSHSKITSAARRKTTEDSQQSNSWNSVWTRHFGGIKTKRTNEHTNEQIKKYE